MPNAVTKANDTVSDAAAPSPKEDQAPVRQTPDHVDTDLLELGDRRVVHPQRVAVSRRGMVATAHHRASEAGAEILADGGNAIDAAVAAAFALGVCEPAASGLGGQTTMVVHLVDKKRTFGLDGSSRAPNRTAAEGVTKEERLLGYRATTVPSTPATLAWALREYGTLPLARVLEPSIRLARKGYRVSALQQALTRRELGKLANGSAAPFFLKGGQAPYVAGARHRQPVLAETLARLARHGIEDFYSGDIAAQIDADMAANGGLIGRDDLAQIPWPIERRPLTARYEGMRVFTLPPPAAGRTLVEMLNVYQQLPAELRDLDSPRGAVALAETIRRAFRDRRDRPFDAHFYAQVSEKRMLSTDHARRVARRVVRRATAGGDTTHLSVMDGAGNVVGLTQSIERVYGAGVATPGLGFLYNNYMSAFETKDIAHPYYLRPNAVPWGSVAPTIVFRGPTPWLVIGSPGSDRITPSILQVLLRLETHTPFAAVDAPRLFCALGSVVSLEASRMRDDIPGALKAAGFEVQLRDPYSFYLGCVQLVLREGEELIGVADPRRDGSAAGPARPE